MKLSTAISAIVGCPIMILAMSGCGGGTDATSSVAIDGSSTVYPITEAVAEEYQLETGGAVRVTVGVSGTGGGFKRFCAGETDINNASRELSESEAAICEQNGVEPLELPIANDGISVTVHPENTWAECLTVEELRRIWEPGSTVERWSDVRPDWPESEVRLYGPGTDSGTFDYFTEEVVGESGASRPDYTASEDDNVLVQGVSGDTRALAYFGFAYYEANVDRVNVVAIDAGDGCVEPTVETVNSGEYAPLSRPVFLYAARSSVERPVVRDFLEFYMENAAELSRAVGYVPLGSEQYRQNIEQLAGPEENAAGE